MKTGGKKNQEKKKNARRKYEKELIQKGRESKKRSGKNDIRLRRSFRRTQRSGTNERANCATFALSKTTSGFALVP
jgi:hypothetical protein